MHEIQSDNQPEQRLDVQLRHEKFVQLDAAFSELKSAAGISEEQRYPSLTYNSLTQTVTVIGSIHESAARSMDSEMKEYVKVYLSTRSPDTLQNPGSTTEHFPEPDGGFIYSPVDGEDKVTIVYEDIWIHAKGVNVFILISFKETPRFAYPATPSYQDITDWRAARAAMSRTVGRTTQLNIQQGCYGPLRYRHHTWVGELQEVFIEVWRQDTNSSCGSPLANDDLPGTLGIRISDFYPQSVWQASDIEDGTVPFNSSSFLGGLRRDISKAAQNRFEEFLFEKLGLL
ncbi:hypothetical protein V1520DRAFT_372663 [Lipomyces starkeyi]